MMNGLLRLLVAFSAFSFSVPVVTATATGEPPTWAQKHAIAARKWFREKGYYKTVRVHHLPFAQFTITRLADGAMIVIYGRGYIERLPGSHLWMQHLPPRRSSGLWLWQCVGGSRRHLFFIAKAGPKWASTWLCSVRPGQRAEMLLPIHGYGSSAAFADGHIGAFTVGSHLVVTVDGGRHWLPQPDFNAGRLYRLKWLNDRRLLVAGVKGTLLLRVPPDGIASLRGHGTAVPLNGSSSQCELVRLSWPDLWWAVVYPRGGKKAAVLSEVDLKNGKVLAHYKVRRADAFFLFHGGFVAVVPRGQFGNWLEAYRTGKGSAVLMHRAKADFGTMLEWRPHGKFIYNGNHIGGLYQFDVNTGVIKSTSIQLKKWTVPPNPNSPAVIMKSKAFLKANGEVLKVLDKLRGPYIGQFVKAIKKLGHPGINAAPWKWMRAITADVKKLYAEQEAAARK